MFSVFRAKLTMLRPTTLQTAPAARRASNDKPRAKSPRPKLRAVAENEMLR